MPGRRRRLTDAAIGSGPALGRRRLVAGALSAAGLAAGIRPAGAAADAACGAGRLAPTAPAARETAQLTDSDGGPFADPPRNDRQVEPPGGERGGPTDSDGGQWADDPGGGRRRPAEDGAPADPACGPRPGSGAGRDEAAPPPDPAREDPGGR